MNQIGEIEKNSMEKIEEAKMKYEKVFLFLIVALAVGVWVIVLQNSGIIPRVETQYVKVANIVAVRGSVDVDNTVDVRGSVDVDNTVDMNLSEVVGYSLVTSKKGMHIGVISVNNTIIPIDWGEVDVKIVKVGTNTRWPLEVEVTNWP